jgi:hypothetical protein
MYKLQQSSYLISLDKDENSKPAVNVPEVIVELTIDYKHNKISICPTNFQKGSFLFAGRSKDYLPLWVEVANTIAYACECANYLIRMNETNTNQNETKETKIKSKSK